MAVCYEITAVPIYRDSNPIFSPAAELAGRLKPQQTIQFRLHRDADRIRCFFASDAEAQVDLAARGLPENGYIIVPARMPSAGTTTILLGRKFTQRTLITPEKPPRHVYLPVQLCREEKQAEAMMTALHTMPVGTGIHFSIRRVSAVSQEAAQWLHRMQTDDPVIRGLLFGEALYQVVGCLYGSDSGKLEQLLSEVLYAFPGLSAAYVAPTAVSDGILNLYHCDSLPNGLRALSSTVLPLEVQTLTDLRGGAGRSGLPYNKDTLFGMPVPQLRKEGDQIRFGHNARGESVQMPLRDLNKHVLISAPPGSGKGNMIINLALQLHDYGIPFLILEAQKKELHHLAKKMPLLNVWEAKTNAFVFNPFALPMNITKGEYQSFLQTMIAEAFDQEGPLQGKFGEAVNLSYALHGYSEDSTAGSERTQPFGLHEFVSCFSGIMDAPNYSAKTQADVKEAGLTRLQILFNQDRAVFDSVKTIPPEALLGGENVLQLNCLTGEARQIFASMLLLQFAALFRLRGKTAPENGRPRLVIIVDEAHALLQKTANAQGKISRFSREYDALLKTLRSVGVSVVTVTQTTDDIDRCILDGCQTKLLLGSSPYNGIEAFRGIHHADKAAMEHLYLLQPGEGILCSPTQPRGVYFRTPFVMKALNISESCPVKNRFLETHPDFTLHTYQQCAYCPARGSCCQKTKAEARAQATVLVSRYATRFKTEKAKEKVLDDLILEICVKTDDTSLRWCMLIQTARDVNRLSPGTLNIPELIKKMRKYWK